MSLAGVRGRHWSLLYHRPHRNTWGHGKPPSHTQFLSQENQGLLVRLTLRLTQNPWSQFAEYHLKQVNSIPTKALQHGQFRRNLTENRTCWGGPTRLLEHHYKLCCQIPRNPMWVPLTNGLSMFTSTHGQSPVCSVVSFSSYQRQGLTPPQKSGSNWGFWYMSTLIVQPLTGWISKVCYILLCSSQNIRRMSGGERGRTTPILLLISLQNCHWVWSV